MKEEQNTTLKSQIDISNLIPQKENVVSLPSSQIHTMKSDVSEAIRTQHETSVTIALAEERKKENIRKQQLLEKSTQIEVPQKTAVPISRIIIIIFFILFIISLVLVYFFVVPKMSNVKLPDISGLFPKFSSDKPADSNTNSVEIIPFADSIIPVQSEERISLNKKTFQELIAEINKSRNSGIVPGLIKNIHLTKTDEDGKEIPITSMELLSFSKIAAPEGIFRTIEPLFMLGYYGEQNGNATPFLLLTINDSDTGIMAMLSWEKEILGFINNFSKDTASSTTQMSAKFSDIIIQKNDVREASTQAEQTILYTFPSKNSVLITGTRTAMEALLLLAPKN